MFVNLATGSQTPAALDHKHKHDQAAAARPGSHRQQLRDQLGRWPPAPGTRTTDQAALGSHQAARPAANNCSSCINLAANNCTRCSN